MAKLRILCFLAVSGMLLSSADASVLQDSIVFRGDVEKLFVEAMRDFTAQKFDTAALAFSRILKEYPRSHRSTGAYIMGAKAYYRIGNYRESIRLLKDLIDLYALSQYIDDAHFSMGLDYYRLGRFEDAAHEFLVTRQTSHKANLVTRSERMLELLAATQLTVAQLQMMIPDASIDATKALLGYSVAEKIFRTGDVKNAESILRSISSLPPNIKYVSEALQLLSKIQKSGVLKIGVALPLMLKAGPGAQRAGLELLEGVRLAADEYNLDGIPKVNPEIRDTEGDPSVASRSVSDLCSDDGVAAILGPVSSEEVFAAAGVANTRGVPLLTPTATRNGIAAVGPYIFQANPDYDTRGRAMARYAFEQRNARRFAVVASQGSVGEPLAESFIDEVKKLGGELVDVEWYFAGSTDMRPQLLAMRKRALEKVEVTIVDFAASMRQSALRKIERWGVPSQVLDSLVERNASASVTFLFGKDGKHVADSLGIPTEIVPIKSDSLAIPVDNIDAMFVPIAASDEIGIVTSQIKYYNFQTLLLGTEDWNELSELDENRQYSNGAIFSTDTYINTDSQAYKVFSAKYQKAYGKKPTKNTLLGYDSMMLLLQVVRKGATQRNEIAAALPTVRNFNGLHSTISFVDNRVNSFLTILQFKNRTVSKIGEIDLSQPLVSQQTK